MNSLRVVFAGTPAFALASLARLVASGVRPVAVLTQPDRPSGRGRRLTACPVKQYALDGDLPVLQPQSLADAQAQSALAALEPDILIVAAYGLILPPAVLELPRHGCLNVHASLLPRWRGAAPIPAAILAGDRQTGISLMQMEAGLDTGPVYATAALAIGADETAGELHDRLATLGGDLLASRLPAIVGGELEARPQDESLACYAAKITTADAGLDWRETAGTLARRVRAYNPVPGARFELDGETVKCWRAEPLTGGGGPPGTVVATGKNGIDIACADGLLRLSEVQRAGRRRVSGAELAAQLKLAARSRPARAG